jgi:hypothetical protein
MKIMINKATLTLITIFLIGLVFGEKSLKLKNAYFIPNHADGGRRSLMHVDLHEQLYGNSTDLMYFYVGL